jgi:uncharacterized membrane protein
MAESHSNSRLEAFCDGVFAIALTLLIIEIKIPSTEDILTTSDLWLSLQHLFPSVLAFLLSFVVILITWVNHNMSLKLVHKSSSAFVYANGFLLLAIVLIPFPTALLGEFLFTDEAAPAVVLYSSVTVLVAVGWILLGHTALKPVPLTKDENSTLAMREVLRRAYFAFVFYSVCAIAAFWFPMIVAVLVGATWLVWLIVGIAIKSN